MTQILNNRKGSSFILVALAAILTLGGVLAACSKTQTTTSAPVSTSTSVSTRTTTSAPATSSAPTTTSALATTTATASAADFFKGNVVTIVVPYAAGGGVDIVARLFANYWNESTGGRMVVVNKDGAGGITGTNYTYAAKPDGLTMGVAIPGAALISTTLAQDPAVKFDIKKINWVIFTNYSGSELGISAKLPHTSMADLQKVKGLKFASAGGGGTYGAGLLIEMFGLQDARIILGYGGSSEAFLAVAKGEVDGHVTTDSTVQDAVVKGFAKPIVTVAYDRSPYFPDIPTVPELIKLSPAQKSLLDTFVAALKLGQVFYVQPGVPQDRLDFIRSTFDKIAASDSFVSQAKARWPVWVKPTTGKDFAAAMEKTLAVVTPDQFNQLKAVADKYSH